ncbi:unnamed protein product [Adineta ricciae]|uniref:Golgin-84 n=1 Tax=Adineta ricciae TaxID=249248 RepID=A0A813WSR2_ADIRI|nr:unnamed protein product [Adineta ricciae]CAF0858084.1 unnamed protein product [Adineta ricciae]
MSWLLKHAEDILNRVDQQTNAVLHQHDHHPPQSRIPLRPNEVEFIPETSSFTPSTPSVPPASDRTPANRSSITPTRRVKEDNEADLIKFLNSPTPVNTNETKKTVRVQMSDNNIRTDSSLSNPSENSFSLSSEPRKSDLVLNIPSSVQTVDPEAVLSLQSHIQNLMQEKQRYESELELYKRQQIQYQHQIAESDALLRDLRTREADSVEILLAKDSQISLLRNRLIEVDGLLQMKANQSEHLQNPSTTPSEPLDSYKSRLTELEQELERSSNENQQLIEQLKSTERRLNDEHLQLYEQQQQTKQAKALVHQLEQEMSDYKTKAQRILQTKDKLIGKLKDIAQHRSSTPTIPDQHDVETVNTHDDGTLLDVSVVGNNPSSSNWAAVQYEEMKSENELFKQELQARELSIHNLRNELQEAEVLIQQTEEQSQERTNRLNEQLKEEHGRLLLIEQDYHGLKQELTLTIEDFQKQKQTYQGQLNDREHEIERLRLQLTSKTINHVNDDELEKRLQNLTESLIQKQTLIESLQTEKSSLSMQLERLEKRLDDYETIASKSSSHHSSKHHSTTSIPIDDSEHYENLRYRMPLLRETPYDVDLTKKVKRAANELDRLGIRATMFLRRYPMVRLGVLVYVVILHLWTFILLFTHAPDSHSNTNSIHLKDKL